MRRRRDQRGSSAEEERSCPSTLQFFQGFCPFDHHRCPAGMSGTAQQSHVLPVNLFSLRERRDREIGKSSPSRVRCAEPKRREQARKTARAARNGRYAHARFLTPEDDHEDLRLARDDLLFFLFLRLVLNRFAALLDVRASTFDGVATGKRANNAGKEYCRQQ